MRPDLDSLAASPAANAAFRAVLPVPDDLRLAALIARHEDTDDLTDDEWADAYVLLDRWSAAQLAALMAWRKDSSFDD